MTLTRKLESLRQGFTALGGNVYHHHRSDMEFPCIVWAEEGADALNADGNAAEQALRGTLDYFTSNDIDPMIDSIQATLHSMELAWELNSIQFEETTGLIHWEWTWEV